VQMKVLITGSRTGITEKKVVDVLNDYVDIRKDIDTIIHGGAVGVDLFSSNWCKSTEVCEVCVRPIREDIGTYYLHRNAEMVAMCDEVIAFWDGKSRGTKFTIDYAKARGKKVTIIK